MNQQNQPVFSVVIPIYNVERYIRQCIDSVLMQTYQNFEIVCVNDGSTDQSIRIVNSYQDPRIRVVHQPNKGLSAARNTGINESRGLLIALLDADDFWMSTKLAVHLTHFQSHSNIDISYSASQFVDDDGHSLGMGQYPKLNDITPIHIFCRNPVGNGSAAVMRRSFLMRIARCAVRDGVPRREYFDEDLRQSEDIEFWLRAALDVDAKFEGVAEPLTFYRVNTSGLSANLGRQFGFWQAGVEKNRTKHQAFFNRWYSLAMAYQQRYLARRAVRSGQGWTALQWLHRALLSNWRIITEEPSRTLLTYAAALCSLLPTMLYEPLERFAIQCYAAIGR